MCPHRIVTGNAYEIPDGATHFKFTQPSLRIKTIFNRGAYENLLNAKRLEEEEEEQVLEDTEDEIPGVSRLLVIWITFRYRLPFCASGETIMIIMVAIKRSSIGPFRKTK